VVGEVDSAVLVLRSLWEGLPDDSTRLSVVETFIETARLLVCWEGGLKEGLMGVEERGCWVM